MNLPSTSTWTNAIQGSPFTDNGFQRALAEYEKLPKDKHVERLEALARVVSLANLLKQNVARLPAAARYLEELTAALEADKHAISKAQTQRTVRALVLNPHEWENVVVTLEDLNLRANRVIWKQKPLLGLQSMPITLAADVGGKAALHWSAELATLTGPRVGKTVKGIVDAQVIEVSMRA